MKIGEISKITGLSIDAIRFYERSGLIKGPSRTEAGYREYNLDLVEILKFISHCRSLDIPITELKKLLRVRSGNAKSCREANEVINEQLQNLRLRIKELKRLEKQLADLQSVCNEELEPSKCQIIRSLQNSK